MKSIIVLLAVICLSVTKSFSQATKFIVQPITFKEVKTGGGLQAVCTVQELTKSTTSFNFIQDSGVGYVKIDGQVHSMGILTTWSDGYLTFLGAKFQVTLELLDEITDTKYKVKMKVSTNGDVVNGKQPEVILTKDLLYTELP